MHKPHHKACKRGRKVRKLDPPEIHGWRIRIQKLRYATDFFGDFWPIKRTKRYLVALEALQQALGVFHDTIVADGLIARFSAAGGADDILAAPVNRWLTRHQQVCVKTSSSVGTSLLTSDRIATVLDSVT